VVEEVHLPHRPDVLADLFPIERTARLRHQVEADRVVLDLAVAAELDVLDDLVLAVVDGSRLGVGLLRRFLRRLRLLVGGGDGGEERDEEQAPHVVPSGARRPSIMCRRTGMRRAISGLWVTMIMVVPRARLMS